MMFPNSQSIVFFLTLNNCGEILRSVVKYYPFYSQFIHRCMCDGIASLGNMQISNSRLCESSKCWVYSAVNHPWWISMLFHRRSFCGSARLFVTFGGSGGIMTTARTELPYPCCCLTHVVPRPRLGASLLGGGSNVTG